MVISSSKETGRLCGGFENISIIVHYRGEMCASVCCCHKQPQHNRPDPATLGPVPQRVRPSRNSPGDRADLYKCQ